MAWEQAHGPLPKGHIVIFLDGDKDNLNLDNLRKVSRAELMRLNQNRFLQLPNEVKPAYLAMVKLNCQIKDTEKHLTPVQRLE